MNEISPVELKELRETLNDPEKLPVLLDVREPFECDICRIEGAVNVPMSQIQARISELDPGREYVVYCHHGGRSLQVCMFLMQNGFDKVINLSGGIDAWAASVEPDMPRY